MKRSPRKLMTVQSIRLTLFTYAPNESMRTTIELPDCLYHTLKARACLSGGTLRELVLRPIGEGLHAPTETPADQKRHPPPLLAVIIQPRGVPIPALPAEPRRIEEEEDEAKYRRFA